MDSKLGNLIRELGEIDKTYGDRLQGAIRYIDQHATIWTADPGPIVRQAEEIQRQAKIAEATAANREARDTRVAEIRAAIDARAAEIRAGHGVLKHLAAYKVWPAISPEVEAAMRGALSQARTFDELVELHTQAMQANDHAAASWLELNANPVMNETNEDRAHAARATWRQIADEAQTLRGGDDYKRIAADESEIAEAVSAGQRVRTNAEREHLASVFKTDARYIPQA